MPADNTIIFNIQIAILGVVLVSAFFYLWRMIGRIEDRLERLERRGAQITPPPAAFFAPGDEDIMEQIFGGAIPVSPATPEPVGDVVVTEAEAPIVAPTSGVCEITPATEDEASTTSLSRTKIRKMTIEALRDYCKEKGLSSEGSRSQLMERLFSA